MSGVISDHQHIQGRVRCQFAGPFPVVHARPMARTMPDSEAMSAHLSSMKSKHSYGQAEQLKDINVVRSQLLRNRSQVRLTLPPNRRCRSAASTMDSRSRFNALLSDPLLSCVGGPKDIVDTLFQRPLQILSVNAVVGRQTEPDTFRPKAEHHDTRKSSVMRHHPFPLRPSSLLFPFPE